MDVLWLIAGGVVLAGTVFDVVLTVFQPSLRGPISMRVNRLVWGCLRRTARDGRSRVLTFGGPLAILADVTLWLGGLIAGFGLLYLPAIDAFSFAASVPFGDRGIAVAVYASGVTALTIGFGDVVAATDPLRLVMVVEGAAGAALLSSAITYVLGVYPIVTDQRAAARRFADLELHEPAAFARLLRARGLAPADAIHATLIRNHQQLRRFPVVYYFHPREQEESTYALLRTAALACAVLLWAADGDGAAQYGRAIRTTLERIVDDYVEGYVKGLSGARRPLDPQQARSRLDALADATGFVATGDVEGFAAWAGRLEHFLDSLAAAHKFEPRPLFDAPALRGSPCDSRTAGSPGRAGP